MRSNFVVVLIFVTVLLSWPSCARAQNVLIEAESFTDKGGWVIDQQFTEQMGSPYLLAHGMGQPVEDATIEVTFPKLGAYRLWVRTRDWVGPWEAQGAPGKFLLYVDGKPLPTIFGLIGADWHWQSGGTVRIMNGKTTIALHDLTGFEGRCDAIFFTTDADFIPPNEGLQMEAFRRVLLGLPDEPQSAGEFDLVVVGGTIAGQCAAISAARLGLNVALIHDRPVLGGNNSSEVRFGLKGDINLSPYPALGNITRELDSGYPGNAQPASNYDDAKKLGVVRAEKNIRLFLNMQAVKVEKRQDRIEAVIAKHIEDSNELRFAAPLFADCTDNASLGYLAGADLSAAPETYDQTKESLAPRRAGERTMGMSIQWYSARAKRPAPFPQCPWALEVTEQSSQKGTRGEADWETGLRLNGIVKPEHIRDYAFRAIYGNWSFQKNQSYDKDKYSLEKLDWVAYLGNNLGDRRLLGDVILKQQDVQRRKSFSDAFVTVSSPIETHSPDPKNMKYFPNGPFRSNIKLTSIKPYPVPYRCFYSRNISNLMMAGPCISVTSVVSSTAGAMRTSGMAGELLGMAALLCKKYDTDPRGVYEKHLIKLKQLAKRGLGKINTTNDNGFEQATRNGQLANEGFTRCRNYVRGWLQQADPKTRLLPRDLNRDRDIWNAEDSAADNYPYMVLTAAMIDKPLFDGRMHEILRAETILTSREGHLPDTYSFSKEGFMYELPNIGRMIFSSSEYAKDGLLPITEWLGPSPWSERMLNILNDVWTNAPIETSYGKIISASHEINGEMLQTLSRVYWMTGDKKYLDWAIRLGDYYLLDRHHPTKNEKLLTLRDHGGEIIPGLCELYATVHFALPSRKRDYQKPLHEMLDYLLEFARNKHGMFYNSINPRTSRHNKGLADTWGYLYNGYYTVYLIDNTETYRLAARHALVNLNTHYNYRGYNWGSADDYADTIESAIYLYNREPVDSVAQWMDGEIRMMWNKQQSSGIIEGVYNDGNFARTTLMYSLWKTKGLTIHPWRDDVIFGAVQDGDVLKVSLKAARPWKGRVVFDQPRHKTFMKMPLDWPRINQFPEWFTVEAQKRYAVQDMTHSSKKIYTGSQLQQGLAIQLEPSAELHLLVE